MTIDKEFVLDALLKYNFLPTQTKYRDEMPPILSSISFSKSVAEKLDQCNFKRPREYPGYDAVEYMLTRYNGVPRVCSIPHPLAYSKLALCIHRNWHRIPRIDSNSNSRSWPRRHRDGRIFIMSYDDWSERTQIDSDLRFGRRFIVRTDITNFFPSIYTHSIPWALVGFDRAKRDRSRSNYWFNRIDLYTRFMKRNETQGILIGPATSNLISEVILERVDRNLRVEFDFVRYCDDYTAYCYTLEEAENFRSQLRKELAEFKLLLNIAKTNICSLPQPSTDSWVSELSMALPKQDIVSYYDAISYLDFAVSLADQTPEGSVLKYALRSLSAQKLTPDAKDKILGYAINLAFYHPVLMPLLGKLIGSMSASRLRQHHHKIQTLTFEHACSELSDAVSWALYYSIKYQIPIEKKSAELVVKSRDCVPLLLLYLSGDSQHQCKVISFANSLDKSDCYLLDQYWLLLYQLFLDCKIGDPYKCCGDPSFDIMKAGGVCFIDRRVLHPLNRS